MSVIINGVKKVNDLDKQWVNITLNVTGDECKFTTVQPWKGSSPILEGAELEAWCNSRENSDKIHILKAMYRGADCYNGTIEEWNEWIADGCKNAEVTKEVFHPEIEAKEAVYKQKVMIERVEAEDAVYETRVVSEAVEARDEVLDEDGNVIEEAVEAAA